MPVEIRYDAQAAGWRASPGTLTLDVPVPLLAGSKCGVLWLGEVVFHEEAEDSVLVETAHGRFLGLKAHMGTDVAETGRRLYHTLFDKLAGLSLLRIWNFVPGINAGEGHEETYQRFCSGRARAFADGGLALGAYPAASAVGCQGNDMLVFAIATTDAEPVYYENPLQVPAFLYPKEYGPDAPAFSRAAAWRPASGALYVSGTASVRGHLTVHPGELEGQLTVTADNLRTILKAAKWNPRGDCSPWCCAYVRRAEDAAAVEAWLQAEGWGSPGCYTIVQSDICRKDLQVEVELSWAPGLTTSKPDALEAALR